jgi:hypothetical protein
MTQYMLLLHEKPADAATLTPAEMQEVVARYKAWAGGLAAKGQLSGGEKLTDDGGRALRLRNGAPVASDGPYAEAQDVVGGYFLISATSDDEAVSIAATCPHLAGTQWIEIRRVDTLGG